MSHQVNNIVIVGGGSAGWMTAATLIAVLKDITVTVIESPNIPTVGVGESTIGGIRAWMRMLGIRDEDFMSECDASYKLAIKFTNFYSKEEGPWYYPFGTPNLDGTMHGRDDWFIKKAIIPDTPPADFVESFYPQMALVNANKIITDSKDLARFDFYNDTAYHFDATKFGAWLRDHYCKVRGVNHICDEVTKVNQDDNGIKSLELTSGNTVEADLYVDCTGFSSLLLGETLKVPFKSYDHLIPNNRAWATKIDYTNKEEELVSVTECTAINNGWVWNIPLWSRIGAGYVYSDKYVSPEDAKQEFIDHLKSKGIDASQCEFKDIKMRVGKHEKLWFKNCVAIGLSAAFIEPLESTGLVTTYDFAKHLCSALLRGRVSQWDRDEFNLRCEDEFNYWAQFVSMHYALSHRDDTQYWRDLCNKSYVDLVPNVNTLQTQCLFHQTLYRKDFIKYFQDDPGINCLVAGMNYNANDMVVLSNIFPAGTNLRDQFSLEIARLMHRKLSWKEAVKTAPSLYEYLKNTFYS